MTEADTRIDIKLQNLADQISEVKTLILREISDLKAEQIADLRRENERLADDQRRAWDAIRALENARNQAHGGGKVVSFLMTGVIAILSSSAVAALIAHFFK